jgi:hypothetical protein
VGAVPVTETLDPPAPERAGLCVVARYQEEFDWSASPWPARIIQKGRELPNAGREASSYAWFCAFEPIEPEQTYAFLQGDPRPHAFEWSQLRQVDRFTPLGAYHLTELPDGSPNHPGLQLARACEELQIAPIPDEFHFTAGAMFLVPGHAILRRDPRFWAWLQGRVSANDWLNPWVMERIWPYLLG